MYKIGAKQFRHIGKPAGIAAVANISIAPGLGLWAVIVATFAMGVAVLFGRRS